MKLIYTLLFPITLLGCSTTSVPHYKKYQATPVRKYEKDILDFYSRSKPYGEFSNFALFPIDVDGKLWPTSEHYYQAHKYTDSNLQEWVRKAQTPLEAAKRGRDKSKPKRKDWKEAKDAIMERALVAKFTQYKNLKKLLLSTGNSVIYEHTENDCYWGDCGNRTGKNKLGKALMRIRKNLSSGKL